MVPLYLHGVVLGFLIGLFVGVRLAEVSKHNSMPEDLVFRLRKRAEIRRQISTRKSVQEGSPDRLADLLEEAAAELDRLNKSLGGQAP